MNKKSTHFNEHAFQKFFIGVFVASLLISVGQQIYYLTLQYPHNPNLSSFLIPGFWLFTPLVYVVIAYVTQKKVAGKLHKLFDALLVAISAAVLQSTLSMVLQPLYRYSLVMSGSRSFLVYEGAEALLVAILLSLILIRLRRTKRW